jgi:hypothetical protein
MYPMSLNVDRRFICVLRRLLSSGGPLRAPVGLTSRCAQNLISRAGST